MDRQSHWNKVYQTKAETELSWYEPRPAISITMMEAAGLNRDTYVVDIGGGDSHLVDALSARGLHCLAVLDVSGEALSRTQTRLGAAAVGIVWIESDVTGTWSLKPMDIWHDRAVFHFLVEPADRRRYVAALQSTLKPHGTAILATFAPSGPDKCSGLPVVRYSPESLSKELGSGLDLVDSMEYMHVTPWGATQMFQYSRLILRSSRG